MDDPFNPFSGFAMTDAERAAAVLQGWKRGAVRNMLTHPELGSLYRADRSGFWHWVPSFHLGQPVPSNQQSRTLLPLLLAAGESA